MTGNSKICIGIQSHLILPEFIYLILPFEKSNLRVQRNNTLNLDWKEVRDQFLENLNFPYGFCNNSTVSKLQPICGKIEVV